MAMRFAANVVSRSSLSIKPRASLFCKYFCTDPGIFRPVKELPSLKSFLGGRKAEDLETRGLAAQKEKEEGGYQFKELRRSLKSLMGENLEIRGLAAQKEKEGGYKVEEARKELEKSWEETDENFEILLGAEKEKEGGDKVKDEKKAYFRWSKQRSKDLLEFLAEEVRKGNRPNNTFRTSSVIAAAKMISEKFNITCTSDHVENHMRTVRTTWEIISQVRGRSGFGWDDNVKMVTASPKAYEAYVQQFPSHKKYLNKKIDMYDEIAIVVGKDVARENYSKTFGDIQINSSGQPSTVEVEPTKSDSGTSSVKEEESDLRLISSQLGEVASALKKISDTQLDVNKLYDEVMKMEDVDEAICVVAFDHLMERELLARAFLAKSEALRKLWFQNFIKSLG